ncbi:uncharacterized protein LOC142774796 [Rhipicephalus microplus]|uniref:uncharacterized protein LOC142774796 n=1 Tax=Rhipicephalus microplus TaxID=6941 RepID=UPI003F6A8EA0
MFIFILPFLVDLASGGSSQPGTPFILPNMTLDNLTEALNTSERFWQIKRNYSLDQTDCNYWLKIYLNMTDYDYEEWFRKRRTVWTKYNLNGTLSNQTDGPTMTSTIVKTTSPKVAYTLKFWSTTEKCAIFTNPGGRCEQRAWSSRVTSKNEECEKAYESLCGRWGIPSYKESCINPNALCIGLQSKC